MRYTDADVWTSPAEETMELLDDRVVITTVKRSRPPKVTQRTVMLDDLQSAPTLTVTTHRPFSSWIFWAELGLAIVFGGIGSLIENVVSEPASQAFMGALGLPVMLIVGVALYTRVEPFGTAKFEDPHARQVVLTVTCRRQYAMTGFEQFVNAVSERIRQRGSA